MIEGTQDTAPGSLPGQILFRRFIVAAVAAALLGLASVGVPGYILLHRLPVAEAKRDALELAAGLSACELSPYIRPEGPDAGIAIPQEAFADLDEELEEFLTPFSITAVSLYDERGILLYDSTHLRTGADGTTHDHVARALRGEAVAHLDPDDRGEGPAPTQVESCVPLLAADGAVLGVFQIHKEVGGLLAQGRRQAGILTAGLLLALTPGLALLTLLVRQATRQTDRAAAGERATREYLAAARDQSDLLAQQAQQANRAKTAFLANMSHEIRTPLTSILGYTDLLAEEALPADRRAGYLEVVARNGRHLLAVLDDILDLARIEAGKLVLEAGPTDVGALVAEVVANSSGAAAAKGLRLETEFLTAVPPRVQTDALRLRQALANLVDNAVKFTPRGSVRVLVSHRDGSGGSVALRFDVQDTGVGIGPEQRPHLFEPFRQGDSSITRRFGGTGLGLGIARSLASLLGGRIDVESVPGRGSTFTLRIVAGALAPAAAAGNAAVPVPGPATAPEPGAEPAGGNLAGLHILLADDARDNQVLVATILRKAGASVRIAGNGREAVDLVHAETFDLVLMDWQMPVLDGLEATRLLRREGFTLPILALTANAMLEDREAALAAGCDEHLPKPVNRRRLLERVAHFARLTPVA